MNTKINQKAGKDYLENLYKIIFESDSKAGKVFDVGLIIIILLSVLTVMLDSVSSFELKFGQYLEIAEWSFTIFFTIEYILRMICRKKHAAYVFSFFGVVDLMSIVPTYISIFLPGSHFLIVIRILRVLRIFRVLKLVKYVGESNLLIGALQASQRKITVFLFTVATIVVIFGL